MTTIAHAGDPIHDWWDAVVHLASGPDHLLAIGAAVLLAILAVTGIQRRRLRRVRIEKD